MSDFDPTRATADDTWIEAALRPRSVAIVGASENPEKIGGRPIKYMLQQGFKGRLYPINPTRARIQGLVCYASLDALPEVPDMVVICLSGEAAVGAVEASARIGVRVGVVISSGFAETGANGREAQTRMVTAARSGGMRLVGPNTQGLVNFSCSAIASFATVIGEVAPEDGPVAIVSQSGAMSVVPYAFLRDSGIGVRHAHATGNECDLTVADFALAVAADPAVRLILLYMESIADPDTLARAAVLARSRAVPIIVLKAGVSARGQAAASSHTGALATEDNTLNAYFLQNGILRVPDIQSLVSSARLILRGHKSAGRRVVAISNSGACCVMAADAAERHGLDMEPLPEMIRTEIESVLPTFASAANPIDLTAALLSNSHLFGQVLPIVAKDDVADAYFISLPTTGKGYDVAQFAQDTASFASSTQKPTVVASPLASTRRTFESAGVVTFEHDEQAMAALGQLASLSRLRTEAERLHGLFPARRTSAIGTPPAASFLSEHRSLEKIAALGIPVAPYRLCADLTELRTASRELKAPWVMKVCSADIPHKSEYGLVRLGVHDISQAEVIFKDMIDTAKSLNKSVDGIILATMLRSDREMIVGARWDARFGAVIMVGDGGKYVEAMPDVITLLYPFDVEHAIHRMKLLRMAPLFVGVRGERPLPMLDVATTAVRLGKWMSEQAGLVLSADINPLMLGQDGSLAAADALVEIAGS